MALCARRQGEPSAAIFPLFFPPITPARMTSNQARMNGFAMAVVIEGGLALVALALAWLFGVSLRALLPQGGTPLLATTLRGVVVAILMLAVFFWLVHSSRAALRELRGQVEYLIGEMFPDGNLAQFALVALLAGVGEELLFRGVIQSVLSRWTTPIAGLLITSTLFALAHALSKLYFLLALVIGFGFGWLVFRYNDLVAPMVAHTLYDFVALIYLSRTSRLRRNGDI
jgi:membrane protease YdiL (CAAX protease family)